MLQFSMPDNHVVTRHKDGRYKQGVSGNPRGRPPMMPPEMRQRLVDASPEIIDQIIISAKGGDMAACRLVLERLAPVSKASAAPVHIDGLEASETLSEKASCILNSIARGECPADVGATLIQSIGAVAKIIEIDELDRRITALEAVS